MNGLDDGLSLVGGLLYAVVGIVANLTGRLSAGIGISLSGS
jgi:hypothetical protein